ncbi:unnamed protein product [Prunus brigantina]
MTAPPWVIMSCFVCSIIFKFVKLFLLKIVISSILTPFAFINLSIDRRVFTYIFC